MGMCDNGGQLGQLRGLWRSSRTCWALCLRRGVAMLAATALRARAGRYAVLCVCVRGLPPLECCEGDVHDLNAPAVYHLISAAMQKRFRFDINSLPRSTAVDYPSHAAVYQLSTAVDSLPSSLLSTTVYR